MRNVLGIGWQAFFSINRIVCSSNLDNLAKSRSGNWRFKRVWRILVPGVIPPSIPQSRVTGTSNTRSISQRYSTHGCPCGYYGDPIKPCICSAQQVEKYRNRISGPLMDRMDIQLEVQRVTYDDLTGSAQPESSAQVRQRVESARKLQNIRLMDSSCSCNAEMGRRQIQRDCHISQDVKNLLQNAFERFNFTARAYDRILKVARTIADLAGAESIQINHVAEAIQYRSLDRKI